jgi:hypothetical protein
VDDPLLTTRQPNEPEQGEPQDEQANSAGLRLRLWLLAPAASLVLVAYGVGLVPSVARELVAAAAAQQQPAAGEALVLEGRQAPPPQVRPYHPSAAAWSYGGAAAGGALMTAALGLWWQRLGRRVAAPLLLLARGLKAVHDGSVGDYAVWFAAGTTLIALAWGTLLT